MWLVQRYCRKCGKGLPGKGSRLFLDPWDVVGLRRTASVSNVPKKCGPHCELFFFLIKKKPFALVKAVAFRPVSLLRH